MPRRSKVFQPTDPIYARWMELRAKAQRAEDGDKEPCKEWHEVDAEWSRKTLFAHPRPTCCENAQRYPSVTFEVRLPDDDGETPEGRWVAHMHSGLIHEFPIAWSPKDRGISWYENRPEAKACPYCGTPLPKMVYRPDMPDVCRTSDHNYCNTCSERLHNCKCLPPSAAFEPER